MALMSEQTNPASVYGLVAEREYAAAPDWDKPKLAEWLAYLPSLSDAAFLDHAAGAIYDSALANRFRGNWEGTHCRATAAYGEAKRRHLAAGHSEDCQGPTLYSNAHARIMREHGYSPSPDGTCTCNQASVDGGGA